MNILFSSVSLFPNGSLFSTNVFFLFLGIYYEIGESVQISHNCAISLCPIGSLFNRQPATALAWEPISMKYPTHLTLL